MLLFNYQNESLKIPSNNFNRILHEKNLDKNLFHHLAKCTATSIIICPNKSVINKNNILQPIGMKIYRILAHRF